MLGYRTVVASLKTLTKRGLSRWQNRPANLTLLGSSEIVAEESMLKLPGLLSRSLGLFGARIPQAWVVTVAVLATAGAAVAAPMVGRIAGDL